MTDNRLDLVGAKRPKRTHIFAKAENLFYLEPHGAAPGRSRLVDPAAGSFLVMRAAHQLGRDFIGCDLASLPAQFERSGPLLFAYS
jgi:hypothetical protein